MLKIYPVHNWINKYQNILNNLSRDNGVGMLLNDSSGGIKAKKNQT